MGNEYNKQIVFIQILIGILLLIVLILAVGKQLDYNSLMNTISVLLSLLILTVTVRINEGKNIYNYNIEHNNDKDYRMIITRKEDKEIIEVKYINSK